MSLAFEPFFPSLGPANCHRLWVPWLWRRLTL